MKTQRQGKRTEAILRVDLHSHTTHSDGELTPEALVRRALSVGVSHLGITDHDTVSGLRAALAAAERTELEIIAGIEVTSQLHGREIHILGHNIRWEAMSPWCEARREERRTRLQEMAARLTESGVPVDFADVEAEAAGATMARPHLARVLVKRGHAASLRDAFDRFLTTGRSGYVERPRPDPDEVIRLIREAGGTTSLAHPVVNKVSRAELAQLAGQGLDAVEAYHPDHPPQQSGTVARWAKDLGLLVTGGSDFHGVLTHDVELGAFTTPAQSWEALRKRAVERQSSASSRHPNSSAN